MICPRCKRTRPAIPNIAGIWFKPYTNIATDIAYRCACRNNRSIPWGEAWEPWKAEARKRELPPLPEARQVMLCRDYRARMTA